MKKGSFFLKLIFILFTTFLFIYLAFRNEDLGEVFKSLKKVNFLYALPMTILILFSIWLRALRWQYFLFSLKKTKQFNLFSATIIGFMTNNFLPRVGELVRIMLVGKNEKISRSAILATLIIERTLDGLSIMLLMFLSILIHPGPPEVKIAGFIASTLFLIALICILFLKFYPNFTLKLFEKIISFFPSRISKKLRTILLAFYGGLEIFGNIKYLIFSIIISILIWVVSGLGFYCISLTYQDFNMPFMNFFVVLGAIGIAVMIPIPGYIGSFQEFVKTTLIFYGISSTTALSFAILTWAINWVIINITGLIFSFKEGFNMIFSVIRQPGSFGEEETTTP